MEISRERSEPWLRGLLNNPLGWSTLRLRGGWPVVLVIMALGFFGVEGLVKLSMASMRHPHPRSVRHVYEGWAAGVTLVQILVISLSSFVGALAAVQRDIRSRMLESHRIMPVRPALAIFGYMSGGLSTGLSAAIGVFLAGLLVFHGAHAHLSAWLLINVVLAVWGVLLGCLATFLGLLNNRLYPWAAFMGLSISCTALITLQFPGIMLLRGAFGVAAMHAMRRPISPSDWSVFSASLGAQVVLALIFYLAAMRKYRYLQRPPLGGVLGLALLVTWAATNYVTMQPAVMHDLQAPLLFLNRAFARAHASEHTMFLWSLVTVFWLASSPASGSAVLQLLPRVNGAEAAPARVGFLQSRTYGLLIFLGAVLVPAGYALVGRPGRPLDVGRVGQTAVVIFFALLAMYCIRAGAYRTSGSNSSTLSKLWLLVIWLVPFPVEGIIETVARQPSHVADFFGVLTPLGALVRIWSAHPGVFGRVGMVTQAGWAALAAFLLVRVERNIRRTKPPKPADLSAFAALANE